MTYFTYNGRSSADFGLHIEKKDVFSAPEYDAEFISIPGRSGDIINPNFSIERKEYKIAEKLPGKEGMKRENVLTLLQPLGEEGNYTKHYFPKADIMKVFLKGGSNLQVNVRTGEAVYESVTRRPLIGAMARLHYNPGQWWTYFADIFAVGLIIITLSGVIMLKGNKGIIGRGGIEMIVGIVIPILFLLFF